MVEVGEREGLVKEPPMTNSMCPISTKIHRQVHHHLFNNKFLKNIRDENKSKQKISKEPCKPNHVLHAVAGVKSHI